MAARFDTVHVDLGALPGTYDRRMWSVDRLHPSERGHRLLARCFAAVDGFPAAHAAPVAAPVVEPVVERA